MAIKDIFKSFAKKNAKKKGSNKTQEGSSAFFDDEEELVVHDLDREFDQEAIIGRKGIIAAVLRYFIQKRKDFFALIQQKKEERVTLMFIPHNDKKLRNYHISNLTLTIIVGVVTVIVLVSSVLIINHNSTVQEVDKLKISQHDAEVQFARIRKEIREIGTTYEEMRKSISKLYALSKGKKSSNALFGQGGAVVSDQSGAQLAEPLKAASESIPIEVYMVNRILNDIEIAEKPLEEIEAFLNKRGKIIKNTPTLWPVRGYVVNPFGNITSAINYNRYFNYGIDIAAMPNARVIATAPGVVTSIRRDSEWMYIIRIRHNYGYETVYKGLERITVSRDQKVTKKDVIGFAGRPAGTLESMVHYQVRIGVEPVDPMPYLSMIAE